MKGMKTGGRQKGSANIKTTEMREKIYILLNKVEEAIEVNDDISHLKPNERAELFCKLVSYVCPKPAAETTPEEQETRRNVNDILAGMLVGNNKGNEK